MKLGFIGTGNMAGAIMGGIIKNGVLKPEEIIGSDILEAGREKVHSLYGICVTDDNREAAKAEIVVLSVKPQYYEQTIAQIRDEITEEQVIVTLAPGKTLEWLQEQFGKEVKIGVPFEVRVSNKEEVYTNTVPKEIVKELALMKAENVASEIPARNVIVIGADTIVVHEEQILGKPKDEQEAFEMIRSLQGDTHQVYTGVAVLDFDKNGEKTVINHAVETKVSVNPMSTEEIQKYIESKEPMDKAGAYGIQGRFSAFIEKIEGDYFNVVGLPVSYVYQVLKELGEV